MSSTKLVEIHPDALNKLNEFFVSEFKNIDDHLNKEVIQTNMSEGHWLIPVVDVSPGVPTKPSVEQAEGAYPLNEPGRVTLVYEKVPANTVVIRYRLDYDAATFAAKSKNAFRSVMGPIVNDMVEELRDVKGFNEFAPSYGDYYGRFSKLEGDGLYFKDTESNDGVEIRLVSNSSRLLRNNKL